MSAKTTKDYLNRIAGLSAGKPVTKTGTVTVASPLQVAWDGETDSGATFACATTYAPIVGDRVIAQLYGNAWVVLSSVNASDTWHALTLATGWTNLGGAYQTLRYTKINGLVHVQGVVQKLSPAASDTIVTGGAAGCIPAGYRPANSLLVPGVYSSGFSTRLSISNLGGIGITATVGPTAGSTYNIGVLASYPAEV